MRMRGLMVKNRFQITLLQTDFYKYNMARIVTIYNVREGIVAITLKQRRIPAREIVHTGAYAYAISVAISLSYFDILSFVGKG